MPSSTVACELTLTKVNQRDAEEFSLFERVLVRIGVSKEVALRSFREQGFSEDKNRRPLDQCGEGENDRKHGAVSLLWKQRCNGNYRR